MAGATTELWGYNALCPGPIIELWEGQRATIDFTNGLALDSTVHWHGLAVPSDQDGNPMDPVAPGARRAYSFDVPAGSAGTYWYHPHAHQLTTTEVAHGLAGPLIVRAADDPLQGLPDLTLMITSLALDAFGQVVVGASSMSPMVGRSTMAFAGGALLVNGQTIPVHTLSPGQSERWRIINATADRYLRLAVDGHRFAVVGTDGGLLGEPLLDQSEWLLAPAQRVEIVLTVSRQASDRFALRDLGYETADISSAGVQLLTIQTNADPAAAPFELPALLRPIADLGSATVRQRIVLSAGGIGMGMSMGAMGSFLINGKSFSMGRIDLRSIVGRVEIWDFVNTTMMDHPMHIHGTQFQVLGQTTAGRTSPAEYLAWQDTVNVPSGTTVTIKVRQSMPGNRMVHCHILPHEDAGMMAMLEVNPA